MSEGMMGRRLQQVRTWWGAPIICLPAVNLPACCAALQFMLEGPAGMAAPLETKQSMHCFSLPSAGGDAHGGCSDDGGDDGPPPAAGGC